VQNEDAEEKMGDGHHKYTGTVQTTKLFGGDDSLSKLDKLAFWSGADAVNNAQVIAQGDFSVDSVDDEKDSQSQRKEADRLYREAMVLFSLIGDVEGAESKFTAALRADPSHVKARRHYGELLANKHH
jgi:hypothetical protein